MQTFFIWPRRIHAWGRGLWPASLAFFKSRKNRAPGAGDAAFVASSPRLSGAQLTRRFLAVGPALLLGLTFSVVAPGQSARAAEAPAKRNGRGYTYLHDQVPDGPWSIHIFKTERSHTNLEFCTTLGKGEVFGMSTVSEQVKELPQRAGQPLAAINGDFYDKGRDYEGRPRDLQIFLGELVTGPAGNAVFWTDPSGNPHVTNFVSHFRVVWPDGSTTPFGLNESRAPGACVLFTWRVGTSTKTADGMEIVLEATPGKPWLPLAPGTTYMAHVREVRAEGNTPLNQDVAVLSIGPKLLSGLPSLKAGATLQIVTETSPDLSGVKTAIGGGPTLVRNGTALQWSGVKLRHPRTAIGWNHDYIFLVEVDGRQADLSVGMTLPELAAYMIKLGCDHAMNLDGGGSATLWARGNVMNSPSEGRERPAANTLVLVNPAKSTSAK